MNEKYDVLVDSFIITDRPRLDYDYDLFKSAEYHSTYLYPFVNYKIAMSIRDYPFDYPDYPLLCRFVTV